MYAWESAIYVYTIFGIRLLAMCLITFQFDNDVDFSSGWTGDRKVFINICRAALYVFVDVNFTRNKPYRLFYVIGVQAIMFIESVYVIILALLINDEHDNVYLDNLLVLPFCGTFAILVHTVCCYRVFLCCVGP